MIVILTLAGELYKSPRAPRGDDIVIRAGLAEPENLKKGTDELKLYVAGQTIPGVYSFSVSYAPGRSFEELAAAGHYPNGQLSWCYRDELLAAAAAVNSDISILMNPEPNNIYHADVIVDDTRMSDKLAMALSAAFWRKETNKWKP